MADMTTKTSYKRINISLSEDSLSLLNRVAPRGQKSRVISEALEYYVQNKGKESLRRQIIEGAQARAQRDLSLAEEWFDLENETLP